MNSVLTLAKSIKLLILDVDGVLTDGKLYFTDYGTEIKAFYSQDGVGIRMLQRSGVLVAVITGRHSALVATRMKELKIEHVHQGAHDKFMVYEELKKELALCDKEIAMAGDDLPDLKIMRHCGLAITVANAPAIIKQYAHYCTELAGGEGAAREICMLIMQAQGTLSKMQQHYLI